MGSKLSFVNECTLLGISISNNMCDTNVFSTVNSFYIKSNSVRSDLYSLQYSMINNLRYSQCIVQMYMDVNYVNSLIIVCILCMIMFA